MFKLTGQLDSGADMEQQTLKGLSMKLLNKGLNRSLWLGCVTLGFTPPLSCPHANCTCLPSFLPRNQTID